MGAVAWRETTLRASGASLAVLEAGDGPPLVFLHGGPGLDHRLVLPLAEPLAGTHRCILFDQRGCGRSELDNDDPGALHIDRLVDDIEVVREHLGEERLSLVGWSWGAALALMYGAAHPDRVGRIAALAAGPIPWELVAVQAANRVRILTADERLRHRELTEQMAAARQAGDADTYRRLHDSWVALAVRGWFFDPERAAAFVPTYLALAGDPYRTAEVSEQVLGSLAGFSAWDRMGAWEAPTLVLYGYQDYQPVTQAFTIREWVPQAELVFLNECGHYPWLEQPDQLFAALRSFLGEK